MILYTTGRCYQRQIPSDLVIRARPWKGKNAQFSNICKLKHIPSLVTHFLLNYFILQIEVR